MGIWQRNIMKIQWTTNQAVGPKQTVFWVLLCDYIEKKKSDFLTSSSTQSEWHRASNAVVGSFSCRQANKSRHGAIFQPPPSFICFGLMSVALRPYSVQAIVSETPELSFGSLCAFMWRAQKRVRGNIITVNVTSVHGGPFVRVCVCAAKEGEGSSLNNFPLCTSIATDLYPHHSRLRRARLKLPSWKASLFTHKRRAPHTNTMFSQEGKTWSLQKFKESQYPGGRANRRVNRVPICGIGNQRKNIHYIWNGGLILSHLLSQ